MKNLIGTAIALSFIGLAACSSSDGSGGSGSGSDVSGVDATIAKMGQIADRFCACQDVKCSEGVMRELSSLPGDKPSKDQRGKAMKLAQRMAECQRKLTTAVAPPLPPAPAAPTSPEAAGSAAAPTGPAPTTP